MAYFGPRIELSAADYDALLMSDLSKEEQIKKTFRRVPDVPQVCDHPNCPIPGTCGDSCIGQRTSNRPNCMPADINTLIKLIRLEAPHLKQYLKTNPKGYLGGTSTYSFFLVNGVRFENVCISDSLPANTYAPSSLAGVEVDGRSSLSRYMVLEPVHFVPWALLVAPHVSDRVFVQWMEIGNDKGIGFSLAPQFVHEADATALSLSLALPRDVDTARNDLGNLIRSVQGREWLSISLGLYARDTPWS